MTQDDYVKLVEAKRASRRAARLRDITSMVHTLVRLRGLHDDQAICDAITVAIRQIDVLVPMDAETREKVEREMWLRFGVAA